MAVEYFYNHADKFGIDKTKIGMEGASGGGYLLSGALMILAEHNNSHMVKSAFFQIPMLDDTIWTMPEKDMTPVEAWDQVPFRSAMVVHAGGEAQL